MTVFVCFRFFLMYLINKDETEHTGQVNQLFSPHCPSLCETRMVCFLLLIAVNTSERMFSWLIVYDAVEVLAAVRISTGTHCFLSAL